MRYIALSISSCLGAGYVPKAPGTAGSLLALPLAWVLFHQLGWWAVVLGATSSMILGTWASHMAEAHYRVHDSPHIVIDELTGQLLTLVPVACTWPNLVVGFGLFRLFDTVKPWPAGWIDRKMQGALGVMLDDVVAGLYAGAVTALVVHTGVVNRIEVWLSEIIVGKFG